MSITFSLFLELADRVQLNDPVQIVLSKIANLLCMIAFDLKNAL